MSVTEKDLGRNWLLHPANQVKRLPQSVTAPILGMKPSNGINLNYAYELAESMRNLNAHNATIKKNSEQLQVALKLMNSIRPGTIVSSKINVADGTVEIVVGSPSNLEASIEELELLVKSEYVPNKKFSISTTDEERWVNVFTALASIGMVNEIFVDYGAHHVEVN